jgi:hypothetical protein
VKDECSLKKAHQKIQQQGIRCRAFHESDMGDQMTAFCTEPVRDETRRVFRHYQLLKPTGDVAPELKEVA